MTDRGLPIVDGAPACPFVAFEDDRDGRATAPDHRHRCYAEPRPAPRALAHQDAYCLSSSFPVCPTFQDWARREAAAARPSASRPAEPAPQEPVSRPMPPLERDEYRPPEAGAATESQRRSGQRDWAAPPPWAGAGAGAAAAGAAAAGATPGQPVPPMTPAAPPVTPHDDTPPEARGLAGSAADRLAGPDPADPLAPAPGRSPWEAPAAGALAASAAAGAAWSTPAAPEAGTAARPSAPGTDDDLDDGPDWESQAAAAAPVVASRPAEPQRLYEPQRMYEPPREDRGDQPAPRSQVSRRAPQDPADLFGPAWERPRRNEAYPSLRTRVGLPGGGSIGRVGLGALALLVAALALFFIGPMLLGIGSDSGTPGGGGTATEAPTTAAEPTATPEPTPVPAPTPQVYTVKKGDTISKIAKKFNLTVEQLLAANKQIKDPNKIAIGDEITIPLPDAVNDGSVEGASASP